MDVAASQTSSGQPSTSALPPLPVQPGQEGEEQATNGSTLEDAGTTSSSTLNAEEKGKQKEQESTPLEPERPWPLVEFGIPRPPRHIAPDANVEVRDSHTSTKATLLLIRSPLYCILRPSSRTSITSARHRIFPSTLLSHRTNRSEILPSFRNW